MGVYGGKAWELVQSQEERQMQGFNLKRVVETWAVV